MRNAARCRIYVLRNGEVDEAAGDDDDLADGFSFDPGLNLFGGEGDGFDLVFSCGRQGFDFVARLTVELDTLE